MTGTEETTVVETTASNKKDAAQLPLLARAYVGGVILNINSPAEVRKAFDQIMARAKKLKSKPSIDGILIAQQVKADLELVVGTALDAEMGPVVMFGTGGVEIELMKDVALAGAPLDAVEAKKLIGRTKAGVKLRGYRGKPALHEASVVKALVGLSNIMADAAGRIASIDVNPFLVNNRTGVAADGLIVLKQAAATEGAHDAQFQQLDKRVMELAVDLPYIYDKTLFYRNPRLTNVRTNFSQGSYYDVVNIGTSDGK